MVGGINNSGQIVGHYDLLGDDFVHIHGFLYSGGIYTTIDFPGANKTRLYGINDAGQMVGDNNLPTLGFLYSGGIYTTIDVPGAISTMALGVNDAGQIVGWYNDVNGNAHGFLATPIINEPATRRPEG